MHPAPHNGTSRKHGHFVFLGIPTPCDSQRSVFAVGHWGGLWGRCWAPEVGAGTCSLPCKCRAWAGWPHLQDGRLASLTSLSLGPVLLLADGKLSSWRVGMGLARSPWRLFQRPLLRPLRPAFLIQPQTLSRAHIKEFTLRSRTCSSILWLLLWLTTAVTCLKCNVTFNSFVF